MRYQHVLSFFLITLGFGLSPVFAEEASKNYGKTLLMPYKKNLQQALKQGMSKGPANAVLACQLKAPKIAEELSHSGIRVGRSSHRLRNSANVSPDWVQPILEAYLNQPSELSPRTITLSGNRTGYVEPILIQPLCTTCHGTEVNPDLLTRIQSLYPNDQALGFKTGDFRGVFWVEYPNDH